MPPPAMATEPPWAAGCNAGQPGSEGAAAATAASPSIGRTVLQAAPLATEGRRTNETEWQARHRPQGRFRPTGQAGRSSTGRKRAPFRNPSENADGPASPVDRFGRERAGISPAFPRRASTGGGAAGRAGLLAPAPEGHLLVRALCAPGGALHCARVRLLMAQACGLSDIVDVTPRLQLCRRCRQRPV